MCNLYQAIFSDLFDDLLHGVDLRRASSRALSSLRSDSPTYQRLVTRVMNDAVVASVFSTASLGPPGRQDTRRPPARGQAAHRDTRPARARPAAESSIIPKQIRDQIPVVNGKQVCVRFQWVKGCTFPSCKHLHELYRLPPDVLKWETEMQMGLKAAHPQTE
ncbi:hypothetical protein PF005_g28923 [Phytophthora fragariae]|nr:hypothetical protein PF011_g29764 [Phytophthora fragariae]KAE9060706.1 hypothetical protein PF010_g30111 [Phytophthora fragariae]KAE9065557.1 hypothetical protein PF007_g28803 [Phytophthora fragariae]KAE9067929.1 hypothetical protein PF006_g29893 [Phytophthora fragariae]KAE9166070.1 hypothetical protein PF004_g29285 [Phytophthora fragariae]